MPIEVEGQRYLDRDEVALRLGVQPSTISGWASRNQMPKPDRYISRAPLWLVTTIETWEKSRPGKGWRAGQ